MTNVGLILYGFCNGYFGRGSYHTKRIEAEGADWIVARELDAYAEAEFASFTDSKQKERLLKQWSRKPEEAE